MPRLSATLSVVVISPHLPEGLLQDIGKIITLWAHLEWRFTALLHKLLGVDEATGHELIRAPRISDRTEILVALLRHRGRQPSIDLKAYIAALKSTCDKRDWLAHGIWYRNEAGGWDVRVAKGVLNGKSARKEPQPVTIDNKWCQAVLADITELLNLTETLERSV